MSFNKLLCKSNGVVSVRFLALCLDIDMLKRDLSSTFFQSQAAAQTQEGRGLKT